MIGRNHTGSDAKNTSRKPLPKQWWARSGRMVGHRTAAVLLIVTVLGGSAQGQSLRERATHARERMVETAIAGEGITNEAVLRAMRTVPRHEFVLPKVRSRSYRDEALAIGAGQTISPPFIVAYMTESLDPQPRDKVLEIGTGSGYQAAVLAEIVREVYSIEIVTSLANSAKRRLKRLDYNNVHVKAGDGYKGWPEEAPFDRIIVTCSPESVPQPLVDQLREGGTMIVPIGERYQQTFYLFEKKDGKLQHERLVPTLFVPMTGESEERRQVLPDAANPELANGGFELDTNGDGKADGWHYQRRTTLEQGGAVEGQQFLRFTAEEESEVAQALQGMAVNGRLLGSIDISCWVQATDVGRGPKNEPAGMAVHFYDAARREVGTLAVARWDGTFTWERMRRRIQIPKQAREMIIRIGLNGAPGTLDLDDLRIAVRRRS